MLLLTGCASIIYFLFRPDFIDRLNIDLRNLEPVCFKIDLENHKKGRGRYKRSWFSQASLDLTFSTIFQSPVHIGDLIGFTLYPGLAVYRALCRCLDDDLNLKWPNDICYGEKKIGGILCESVMGSDKPIVIIGIGLNVNISKQELPSDIRERATSLYELKGEEIDIEKLLHRILGQMDHYYHQFIHYGLKDILQTWEAQCSTLHKWVKIFQEDRYIEGEAVKINENGFLMVRVDSNTLEEIRSGTIVKEDSSV